MVTKGGWGVKAYPNNPYVDEWVALFEMIFPVPDNSKNFDRI